MSRQNIVLQYMLDHDIPLTRKNYLELAYMGKPPQVLDPEEEAEIPDEVKEEQE